MQTEERHELKQNDLQDFLANIGEFWKKSGNAILIVITLVVVVFAGYRIYNTRLEARYENTWADLALTGSPASFAELGESLPYAAARAKANLNGADLYLQEASDPSGREPGELPAEEKLQRAQSLYQAVLAAEVHEVMHLNAKLGLAEVALAREDLGAAATQFEQIVAEAGEAYPVHTSIARQRLDSLDRLRHPVPLAADPDPADRPIDAPPPPLLDASDDAPLQEQDTQTPAPEPDDAPEAAAPEDAPAEQAE